jgi:hypothetical protein
LVHFHCCSKKRNGEERKRRNPGGRCGLMFQYSFSGLHNFLLSALLVLDLSPPRFSSLFISSDSCTKIRDQVAEIAFKSIENPSNEEELIDAIKVQFLNIRELKYLCTLDPCIS